MSEVKNEKKPLKTTRIIFWIVFPIIAAMIAFLMVFYLDLANGPLILLIIECIVLALFVVGRILLRNHNIWLKLSTWAFLALASAFVIGFAHPKVVTKSAAYYDNPVAIEENLELKDGLIKGVYNKDKSVKIYAGIPYAKPPIGELRWKYPQDVEKWDGVLDCTHFRARSMQPKENAVINSLVDIYAQKGWHPNFKEGISQERSEDSLYLNIWRPNNNETNLPILVYIHGGSLTNGSSALEDYNGEAMAKKGVIMINIQYRLGIFGFLAHDDLAKENEDNATGNYGLADQVKALEWINENASYFGGDASNITIAGESAGSSSVSALCVTPKAHGLFKRAIGESSSLIIPHAPHTFRSIKETKNATEEALKEFNCSSIEELRKVDAEKLVTTKQAFSSMTIDGKYITDTPYNMYKSGQHNEEALLNGYNVKESDAFVVPTFLFNPTNKDNARERLDNYFGEEFGERIYKLYKDRLDKNAFEEFNEIISVFWFIHPHHYWSKAATDNGVKVFRYQFAKENGYYGTYHSGEIVYCYGNLKMKDKDFAYDESDYNLESKMSSYWANFAKYGDPNGLENDPNLPLWEDYKGEGDGVLEFNSEVKKIEDKYLDLYKILDEYVQKEALKAND